MSRPGLGGFTYSPQYSMTMIEWLEERHRRKQAQKKAVKRKDESTESFETRVSAMPRPRSWSDYMLDPLDDGVVLLNNPTENQNEKYFGIDPNSNINNDSLVTQPWWESRIKSGRDEEAIALYKGYIRDADIGVVSKAAELARPSIFIATGAGDTIPSSLNIFQTEEGGRVQAHTYDAWWKRAGVNIVQGPTGFILAGAVVVLGAKVFAKAFPSLVKAATESVDEGIVEPLKD